MYRSPGEALLILTPLPPVPVRKIQVVASGLVLLSKTTLQALPPADTDSWEPDVTLTLKVNAVIPQTAAAMVTVARAAITLRDTDRPNSMTFFRVYILSSFQDMKL
jgi:hypothetical protein